MSIYSYYILLYTELIHATPAIITFLSHVPLLQIEHAQVKYLQ